MSDYVGIVGRWGQRAEQPEALAQQLVHCLSGLAEIDPLFRQWRRLGDRSHSAVPAVITLPPDHTELQSWVAENPTFGKKGGMKRTIGYSLSAEAPRDKPLWTRLSLFALDGGVPDWFTNHATITLFAESGHEARLAPLVRPVLMAVAAGFSCDWAGSDNANYATPAGRQPGGNVVRYEGGGMVYLAASAAVQIKPPADIGIEHLPNGALLMTVATVFNRKNAQHVAAAHRIQTALAPLNSLSDQI
jgi:immunity protein 52 of polymorphic toxin system